MNLLAIETSTPKASTCLTVGGRVLRSSSWESERNHDASLFPALRQALDTLGEAPLDYILVGAGPGSYGGVRVALAAAVGIATVTGARVVAVDSWQHLAAGGAAIVSDARRNGWTYRDPQGAISVLTQKELLEEIARGAVLYSTENEEHLAAKGISVGKAGLTPTAEGLCQTWLGLDDAGREALAARPAEPIYVRPPHITAAKRKPWEIPD